MEAKLDSDGASADDDQRFGADLFRLRISILVSIRSLAFEAGNHAGFGAGWRESRFSFFDVAWLCLSFTRFRG